MSTKIVLEIGTDLDLDFLEEGILLHLIRFRCLVQLRTSEGWTAPYKAIIDIGTPISVIPLFIWKNAHGQMDLLQKDHVNRYRFGQSSGKIGRGHFGFLR